MGPVLYDVVECEKNYVHALRTSKVEGPAAPPTLMRGFSSSMRLPTGSASMRSRRRLSCHSPVVSPTAATRSARAGLPRTCTDGDQL